MILDFGRLEAGRETSKDIKSRLKLPEAYLKPFEI